LGGSPMERQAGNIRCPILFGAHERGNLAGQLGAQFVGSV